MSRRITRPPIRDTKPKGRQIDIGLAVAGATLPPGQCRDLSEIAAYCGCSRQLIHTIQNRAVAKIRDALKPISNQKTK